MKQSATVALVFASWAACSGSSSPDGAAANDGSVATRGGSDGGSTASGCEQAAALCATLNRCAPFLLAAGYGDVVGCSARLTKVCSDQAGSNGSGMTQANILACKAALEAASCNDVFANNVPQCTFHGSLADGATCGDSAQCASGFCGTGGNLCGACAPKQGAGAPCTSGSNDECQPGLVCSAGKACVTPAAVGGACDDTTQPCLPGSFCTSAKTCALTVAVNDTCPGAYLSLVDGTFCTAKGTQAKAFGAAATGKPCGLAPADGSPATLCAPGGVPACSPSQGSVMLLGMPTRGTCAATTDDGYTCTADSICATGAQCVAGTCQIPSGKLCSASN